jgi:hypothetical protein
MVTLILNGRTGNNMFQYAAARSLAAKLNTHVRIDCSYANDTLRNSFNHLFRFPINGKQLLQYSLLKKTLVKFAKNSSLKFFNPTLSAVNESNFFDVANQSKPCNILLKGDFQSELFFIDARNLILSEFDFSRVSFHPSVHKFAQQINNSISCSVHVRRTDYLKISQAQVTNLNYYLSAIDTILRNYEYVKFYFFSDDLDWCRRTFSSEKYIFFEEGEIQEDPLADMYLMSLCNHNIIANSSYSWWAAWLNQNQGKIVICPKMWMKNTPSSTVVPSSWRKI